MKKVRFYPFVKVTYYKLTNDEIRMKREKNELEKK